MDYLAMQRAVDAQFREYGTMIEFRTVVDEYRSPLTGYDEGSDLSFFLPGIVEDISDFLVDNSNIKTGDKTIKVSALYGIPQYGSEVYSGNQLFRILNVKQYAPAGIALWYEITCRSYALVEDLNTLIVPLGSLELGSIVVDPNRLDTPSWMVVDHDHFKVTYTTLMTINCVVKDIPFKGYNGKWHIAPWSETYIRRYLLNDFKDKLSSKMVKNLQAFTTANATQRTIDTISTPSSIELNVLNLSQSGDYGSPLKYFEVNDETAVSANRISTYENENTAYWTREANGIDTDGTSAYLNINYGHGLRAMICLLKGVNVAYNAAGEYELKLS